MNIKPIKSEADYKDALLLMESLWDAEEGTEDFDKLDILATLIESYERKNHFIEAPDPIQAILFRMDQDGLTKSDMTEYLGVISKVSEVLNYQRELSKSMIRKLNKGLGIPSDILIQEYALERGAA